MRARLLAAVLALGSGAEAAAAGAGARPIPAGLGRLVGRVVAAGPWSPLPAIPVSKDPKACGLSQPDEALEVSAAGGVKNAVLWAANGPPPDRSLKTRVRLALKGCQYSPHVVVAPVGGELLVVNEDAVFHNATGAGGLSFNYAMPIVGHTVPTKLKKAGVVRLESKTHPWMKGWVHVVPTSAAAVTDGDGSFAIDLPPGPVDLRVWQERLGTKEEKVEIRAGTSTVVEIVLGAPVGARQAAP
jgi:plastocyanin